MFNRLSDWIFKLLHNGRTQNEESFENLQKMKKELFAEITEKIESTNGPDSLLEKIPSDSKGQSIYYLIRVGEKSC